MEDDGTEDGVAGREVLVVVAGLTMSVRIEVEGTGAASDDVEDNANAGARWCSRTRGRRTVADRLGAAMSVE